MPGYVGVNNKARGIKNIYVGVNGKARNVKAVYTGDKNGKARCIFSPLAIGTIFNYAYTGGIQTFTVPATGLYSLETWGAKGGGASGGNGGYSYGYKILTKGQILYIVCGGAGNASQFGEGSYAAGGYNGGADGYGFVSGYSKQGFSGGGATHIAMRSGILSALANYKNDILLVSGGGGGSGMNYQASTSLLNGGFGGGVNGGAGVSADGYAGNGGTQTSGGYIGYLGFSTEVGTFGKGGLGYGKKFSGGGGGYYGGAGAFVCASGGGGSGYIGGVPSVTYKGKTYAPSMSNGTNNGVGKAKLTYVSR